MAQKSRKTAVRMKAIQKYLISAGEFRYNIVTGKVELRKAGQGSYTELTDYELNSLARELGEENVLCSPAQLKDILESDITKKYNPFHEYFDGLPLWDGKIDYIRKLSQQVKTTDDEMWHLSFRRWIIALVGSLLKDDVVNHTAIILSGNQGIGKSTWIYNLIPEELKRYYHTGTIKLNDKDTIVMLSEAMVINLEEIGYLGEKGLNELKEIITKPQILVRRPYGRHTEYRPRRASFTASLNEKEFLFDTSGSRRFLSFEVKEINYQEQSDLSHVFAQAKALFEEGEKYWFDNQEVEALNIRNEAFRNKSHEEEMLLAHFEPSDEATCSNRMTATEILNYLASNFNFQPTEAGRQRLGKALKANGFLQKKDKVGRQIYLLKAVDKEKDEYVRKAVLKKPLK